MQSTVLGATLHSNTGRGEDQALRPPHPPHPSRRRLEPMAVSPPGVLGPIPQGLGREVSVAGVKSEGCQDEE